MLLTVCMVLELSSWLIQTSKKWLKVAINYLESLKVYRMFEGGFEGVFNRL